MNRRTAILILAALLAPTFALAAQPEAPEVTYPRLPERAANAQGFVPAGWKLEYNVAGDLNGDRLPDVVLVLHDTNPRNILANPGGIGENPFDSNPRVLVVIFARPGGGYSLALENHSLIPRRVDTILDDYIEDDCIRVEAGVFRITLSYFAAAGSWNRSNSTYAFRFQHGRFELIGFDSTDAARNTGNITTLSVNYLTRRVTLTHGNIESDVDTPQPARLVPGPIPTLDSIGDGIDWRPDVVISGR